MVGIVRMESAQFGPDHVIEIRNGRDFQSPQCHASLSEADLLEKP